MNTSSPRNETKAHKKVAKVMREFKEGKLKSHDKKVIDRNQAIAIALSEARTINPSYQLPKKWSGGYAEARKTSPRKPRRISGGFADKAKSFFNKTSELAKSAHKKVAPHVKAGYEGAKHLTKTAYEKTKKSIEDTIHDKKKNIAIDVLEETKENVIDDKEAYKNVKRAEQIIKVEYKKGGQAKMLREKSFYQAIPVYKGFKWAGFWDGYHHFTAKEEKGYTETRATDEDIDNGNLKDMIDVGVTKRNGGGIERKRFEVYVEALKKDKTNYPVYIYADSLEDAKKKSKADRILNNYSKIVEEKSSGGSMAIAGKVNMGVDLFEDYEKQPTKVKQILSKYEEGISNEDYDELRKAKRELEKIGYTFEYYLDGTAYDLRKIGEIGKVGYAEKHGIGLFADERFERFAEIIRKSNTFEDAWNKLKNIKGVPADIADAFDEKYNPDKKLSLKESFKKFYDEEKGISMSTGARIKGKSGSKVGKVSDDSLLGIGTIINISEFGGDKNVKMTLKEIVPLTEKDIKEGLGTHSYHFVGSKGRSQYYTASKLRKRLEENSIEIVKKMINGGGTDTPENIVEKLKDKYGDEIKDKGITEIFIDPFGDFRMTSEYDIDPSWVEAIEKDARALVGQSEENTPAIAPVVSSSNVSTLISFVEGNEKLVEEKAQIDSMATEMNWDEERLKKQFKQIFSYMAETSYNKQNPDNKIELTESERNEFGDLLSGQHRVAEPTAESQPSSSVAEPNIEGAKQNLIDANEKLNEAESHTNNAEDNIDEAKRNVEHAVDDLEGNPLPFKNAGQIPNNPVNVWKEWDNAKRLRFIMEHTGKQHTPVSQEEISKREYNFLPTDVKEALEKNIKFSIPNNYEGKTPDKVWYEWNKKQRLHFLGDHKEKITKTSKINGEYDTMGEVETYAKENYFTLPKSIKIHIEHHIGTGQYKNSGKVTDPFSSEEAWLKSAKGRDGYWIDDSFSKYTVRGGDFNKQGSVINTYESMIRAFDKKGEAEKFIEDTLGGTIIFDPNKLAEMRHNIAVEKGWIDSEGAWVDMKHEKTAEYLALKKIFDHAQKKGLKMWAGGKYRNGGGAGENFDDWSADDHRKQANIEQEKMDEANKKHEGHIYHYHMAKRDMHKALAKQKGGEHGDKLVKNSGGSLYSEGSSTKTIRMTPEKKKLEEKIKKLERALEGDKLSAKSRASMEKQLEDAKAKFNRRVPVYERIMESKGKFFIEIPAEYRTKMNVLLHGTELKPRYNELDGKLRIAVDNKPKLNRLYKIYSDMLTKKKLSVPTLEEISGKPSKVKRQS